MPLIMHPLQDFAQQVAQLWGMAPRRGHVHVCDCGAELRCAADADRCPIGNRPWTCQACELDAQDAYLDREARR